MIIFIPISACSILVCLGVNLNDSLISISEFKKQNDPQLEEIMTDIAESDNGVYKDVN